MLRMLTVAALVVASLFPAAPDASARTVFGAYGVYSIYKTLDECPPGAYVVGLEGRVGSWIDQLGVICGTVRPDRSIDSYATLSLRGGGGGMATRNTCGPDEVVTDMTPERTKDYKIAKISLTCMNLKTLAARRLVFGGSLATYGVPSKQACPSGELAKGMEIHAAGSDVQGVALVCDCTPGQVWREQFEGDGVCVVPTERFRMADGTCRAGYVWIGVGPNPGQCVTPAERDAAVAANAPRPVASAPPPKPKAAPNVYSPHAQDFHGTWRTVSRNIPYDIVLRVTNGNKVSGEYTSPGHPEWSGTISGMITDYAGGLVQLEYTWTSIATGDGSPGTWKVTTDGRLVGGFTVPRPGQKPIYYKWEGNRVSRDAPGGTTTAGPAPAATPPAKTARVLLPVEVFDAPGGNGKQTGDLQAGAIVAIVAEPGDDWFEVSGDAVPGGRGFVYSGEGYRSLERQ